MMGHQANFRDKNEYFVHASFLVWAILRGIFTSSILRAWLIIEIWIHLVDTCILAKSSVGYARVHVLKPFWGSLINSYFLPMKVLNHYCNITTFSVVLNCNSNRYYLSVKDFQLNWNRWIMLNTLSMTNPKVCRWRHLIGSLARPRRDVLSSHKILQKESITWIIKMMTID